jgi:FkbM family methyltransferase
MRPARGVKFLASTRGMISNYMAYSSRVRSLVTKLPSYISFLLRSSYSPELGWYSLTPDGSRLARRQFLHGYTFNCLITPTDIRIPLEGLDDLDTTVDIFLSRHYERMEESLQPGSVVWDIGANLGVASLIFARHPNVVHIYAYEPMPHTFECALRSLTANSNLAPKITLEPVGIGERDGELEVNYTEKAKAAIGLSEIPSRLVARYGLTPEDMKRIKIQIADADRILAMIREQHPNAPILLKIDAEGAEYGIIDRLAQTGALEEIAYAAIEWHLSPGEQYLTSRLQSAGFKTDAKILESDNSIGMIDAWR